MANDPTPVTMIGWNTRVGPGRRGGRPPRRRPRRRRGGHAQVLEADRLGLGERVHEGMPLVRVMAQTRRRRDVHQRAGHQDGTARSEDHDRGPAHLGDRREGEEPHRHRVVGVVPCGDGMDEPAAAESRAAPRTSVGSFGRGVGRIGLSGRTDRTATIGIAVSFGSRR